MKISFNIAALLPRVSGDVRRAAKLIKAAGFDCIDYELCTMEKADAPLNGEGYRELASEHRRLIEESGLYVNQTHAPFHFKGWDDKEQYEGFVYPTILRAVEISAVLGADTVIIHPIHHIEYRGNEEKLFERNMDYYRGILEYAKPFGVRICTENMWQRDARRSYIIHDICSKKEEFQKYIDTINDKSFVACLDVGHVGLCPNEDEAADFIYALGQDRLKALHIHDNDYVGDLHLAPYLGKMNWEAIGRALGEIDYDGVFTYELNSKLFLTVDDEFLPIVLKYYGDIARHICDIAERNRPVK